MVTPYKPLKILGMTTGLVQEREKFLLPNDAYPTLQNAFVWRERIKRKQGYELLGRLRRKFTAVSIGMSGASPWSFNLFAVVTPAITETDKSLQPGSVVIAIGGITFTDQGNGTLTSATGGNSGTINYATGAIVLTHTAGAGVATTATFNYYPGLPAMGLRTRELNTTNNEMMIAFDQTYAYRFVTGGGGFQEFIPGTTWTGNDSDFFWSTNYWVGDGNQKIFWVTNFSGVSGDPIRYTNGSAWIDFTPQINAAADLLTQSLGLLPFRGRLLAFNTFEGASLATSTNFPQRIRWSRIGTPFTIASSVVTPVDANGWRDDIPGKGGFLDIPTSEDITSFGFVRDNLVIYCERSTWQLRYTGRTIQPFQIEKVNSELGSESTFSAVQFDTSLVGIGDKGIVECDSFKSERIDIKIPDLVFQFRNVNNGTKRVHGIRDFQQRMSFWTYPYTPEGGFSATYPNRRLAYNYENDSWAIFTDSLTCLGTFQPSSGRTWANSLFPWNQANFTWINRPALFPSIVGGNQQGYVEYLDEKTTNDVSLFIQDIDGNDPSVTVVTSPNHNLETGQIIKISGIPIGTPFDNLNDGIFSVSVTSADEFQLYIYNADTDEFSTPQIDPAGVYIGGGQIAIRDNFSIVSKKFNAIDEGNKIQMGFLDILMDKTSEGAISLYVYLDYDEETITNIKPQNIIPSTQLPDTVFNSVIPTTVNSLNDNQEAEKFWQRVFCQTRGQFITLQYTLSNAQMVGVEQESDVQIDAQILWLRNAGRLI